MMDKNMRVASFSAEGVKPSDEILMWSHYALKHTGMRIGFEFPVNVQRYSIKPMLYNTERAAFDISKHPINTPDAEYMNVIIRTKSKAWEYEKEYRLITTSGLCYSKAPPADDLEFLPFDSTWVKRVDFGLRHDSAVRDQILHALSSMYPHVSWFQAEYHDDEFALQYRRIS